MSTSCPKCHRPLSLEEQLESLSAKIEKLEIDVQYLSTQNADLRREIARVESCIPRGPMEFSGRKYW